MFPSFGYQYSPGDLLSSKTFQKVASLDVETISDEEVKTAVCSRSIDSSKLLTDLCAMIGCSNGRLMVNSILNAEERFEPLLNFLYSQPNRFPCVGFCVVREENESCFEVSSFENPTANLMVSKTVFGTFFLCVLTSKCPIKDPDSLMQKFAYVLKEFPHINKEHCEYLDDQNVNITVFANWNEMVCSQKCVRETLEKMYVYGKDGNNQQVIGYEVDDFTKCLPERPLLLDPNTEQCYRLLRSIKNKGAEFRQIYDSKKKRNEKLTINRFQFLLADLEKDLKQTYFLKFEHIEQLNGILSDGIEFLESFFKRWQTSGTALDPFLYQMMESCLTSILTKFNSGNCTVKNNTLFYQANEMEGLNKFFENKSFIALKLHTDNFKEWISPKFLQLYPLCYVKNYPLISDSFILYADEAVYGFGTVTVRKNSRKQRSGFNYEAFNCANPEHKYERFWKCTTCKESVTSDGKEILCKCGINSLSTVELRCSFSDGKICTKKTIVTTRQKNNVSAVAADNKDENVYNIVLLGPFGSGKSTLINAAMNYLEYPTYKDASSRSEISEIPYKFSFFDENFREQTVSSKQIPENCRENFASSSGVTQRPGIYECYSSGKKYRFVDTIGYGADKDGTNINFYFLKDLKSINAVWITISAYQNLGNSDSWIRRIVKTIPKILFPRVYFIFTNIHGKHSLRLNSNVATVAKFFSNHKEFPFEEKNLFAIENNCLKSLYAQRSGYSLSNEDSLGNTWSEARKVVMYLLGKVAAKSNDDDDVFFLINLYVAFLRLKRTCRDDELVPCVNLLNHHFMSASSEIKDKPPSYGDVIKSLQKILPGIPSDSSQHKLLVEFIETFGYFAKDESSGGVVGSVKSFISKFF